MSKNYSVYDGYFYESGFPSEKVNTIDEETVLDIVSLRHIDGYDGRYNHILSNIIRKGILNDILKLSLDGDYPMCITLVGNVTRKEGKFKMPSCVTSLLNYINSYVYDYYKNRNLINDEYDYLYDCSNIDIWDDEDFIFVQIYTGSNAEEFLEFKYPKNDFLLGDFKNLEVMSRAFNMVDDDILKISSILLNCVKSACKICSNISKDIKVGQVTILKKGSCKNKCSEGFIGFSLAPVEGGDSYWGDDISFDGEIQVFFIVG